MQITPDTTFLYPKSNKYPFDEVCGKIVIALSKRNWSIPGIQVEFMDSGTGENKYPYVSKIQGANFKLWFCRVQDKINESNYDVAAVSTMVIPKKELRVSSGNSGPDYFTYVGNNWEKDKAAFMNESKCNSKFLNHPRTYLYYTGNKKMSYLVNDDDLGREYQAEKGEPESFKINEVFNEMKEWLQFNVLQRIELFR